MMANKWKSRPQMLVFAKPTKRCCKFQIVQKFKHLCCIPKSLGKKVAHFCFMTCMIQSSFNPIQNAIHIFFLWSSKYYITGKRKKKQKQRKQQPSNPISRRNVWNAKIYVAQWLVEQRWYLKQPRATIIVWG